jgi:putative peptidoglycan lipid II flippase
MTVSRLLALSIDDGAAVVLNFSTRVMELPIGVFAIAVATVVFPSIARHVAEGRMDRLAADYRHGMKLILLANLPAAAGLLVLAEPITRVLFQRGEFTAEHTAAMAPVLAASALALPLVAYVSLTLRVFYARKDMGTPVRAATWSFVVNVVASVVLMRWFGVVGLAVASTLAAATQAVYLQVWLAGEEDGLRFRHLGGHVIKVLIASVAMAGVVAAGWRVWRGLAGGGAWMELVGLAACVAAGIVVFAACAWGLRIEGREELVALVRRKLGRR